MPSALVLQHQDDAPAGLLGDALANAGVEAATVRVDLGELADVAPAGRPIVALGSDTSVVGGGSRPWVAPEVQWLREAMAGGSPVLGICFGAQLLAAALGGTVTRMARPQVGWVPAGSADASLIPDGPWLSWHEDAVALPDGVQVLARDAYCVQAFADGPHLGVQFHPEVTPQIVTGWIEADGRELSARVYDPEALMAESERRAEQAAADAARLFGAWLSRRPG